VNEELFTAVLAFAWFGTVNLALSAFSSLVAWLLEKRVVRLRWSSAPAVLLTLKLLPGAGALLFTLAVFLPAHWIFEPAGMRESLGYTLAMLGALGALVLVFAVRRAIRDTRVTRRLERDWEARVIGPRQILAGSLPVYRVADDHPVISLAGLRHPRVFVGQKIIELFSDDELDLSLAHEAAHRDAHDNLKRVFVACSPDLLFLWGPGRRLEHRWRAAAEFTADSRAVRGSEERALALASALLKVARLAPAFAALPPGSAFYDGTLLLARIDRLLGPAERIGAPRFPALGWSVSIGGLVAVTSIAAAEAVWLAVHMATEGLVRFLP
jgi:hypothetical protein